MEMWQKYKGAGACPRKIGDVVAFLPAAFTEYKDMMPEEKLSGKVVQIHEDHRYYTVEAECHGVTLRESFKF